MLIAPACPNDSDGGLKRFFYIKLEDFDFEWLGGLGSGKPPR
jgi:hypothetical protein